jgi:hypothetical protein
MLTIGIAIKICIKNNKIINEKFIFLKSKIDSLESDMKLLHRHERKVKRNKNEHKTKMEEKS